MPDDYLGAVERPLYLTAAMTGLRQGELIGLRLVDVDWSASRIRVAESYTRGAFDSPKSHHGRSVPMADRLAGELERHFQHSHWRGERDLVFAHPATGNVLDASKLRKRPSRLKGRAAGRRPSVPEAAMTDVPTIVYELALRSLDQQERELGELRARTNTLVAAAALIASFLGAAAIHEHGGLSAWSLIALTVLGTTGG